MAWKAPCSLHLQVPQEGPLLPMPLAGGAHEAPSRGRAVPQSPSPASLPCGPSNASVHLPRVGGGGNSPGSQAVPDPCARGCQLAAPLWPGSRLPTPLPPPCLKQRPPAPEPSRPLFQNNCTAPAAPQPGLNLQGQEAQASPPPAGLLTFLVHSTILLSLRVSNVSWKNRLSFS